MGKLANIPKFDPTDWKKIGDEITDEIRVQTQKKGKDVFNKNFKPYKKHPPFWFSKKVNGKTIRVYAEDYPTRKPKLKRGGTGFGSKVNLTLTGDMMKNLQTRRVTNEGVTIGWSGVDAQKIQWNEDMGRAVTTRSKPLSNKALKIIKDMANKKIKVNAERETAKPINFKIGK